jgi:rRNA biogenesis protein RRP5
LSDIYPVGKVIKVRILSVDTENKRIMASIRQASSTFKSPIISDVSGIDIGAILEGTVAEIHPENILLTLLPSEARALMSIKNLANHRGVPVAQVKSSLKAGEKLVDLVVVSKNPEKGFVIVSNKPKSKPSIPTPKTPLSMDTVDVGRVVGGRVTRYTRHGAHLKITAAISGSLHPTDISDNYETGAPFPAIDSLLKAVVIAVDRQRKLLTLSTRHSRLHPKEAATVVDREISNVEDLAVGSSIRGFVKSVSDSGLFVTIGRNVDARVQIKELFDEVRSCSCYGLSSELLPFSFNSSTSRTGSHNSK